MIMYTFESIQIISNCIMILKKAHSSYLFQPQPALSGAWASRMIIRNNQKIQVYLSASLPFISDVSMLIVYKSNTITSRFIYITLKDVAQNLAPETQ